MLPPEDRPPLAARVDAAMEEVAADRAEEAVIYSVGLGLMTCVAIGLNLPGGLGFLIGLLVGAFYFLVATRGHVPTRMRPYLLAASLPVAVAVLWLS